MNTPVWFWVVHSLKFHGKCVRLTLFAGNLPHVAVVFYFLVGFVRYPLVITILYRARISHAIWPVVWAAVVFRQSVFFTEGITVTHGTCGMFSLWWFNFGTWSKTVKSLDARLRVKFISFLNSKTFFQRNNLKVYRKWSLRTGFTAKLVIYELKSNNVYKPKMGVEHPSSLPLQHLDILLQ